MTPELQKKVDFAIKLLQAAEKMAEKKGQPVEICYSGGKDSDVILELAKMAGIKYRAIYKNTTIDQPGTIAHVKEMGVEVMQPKKNFFTLVALNGFPTRMRRMCCKYLKEYKVLDYNVVGVRRSESVKRAQLYHEPERCRTYHNGSKARQYMPILEWSDKDVADFLKERNIKCAPCYYDEQGNFHIERRLGCMACCLKSRRLRLEDLHAHPNMVKAYIRAGQKFFDKYPQSSNAKRFGGDVYKWFCMDLFCDNMADFEMKFGKNMFDEGLDCKQFLMDYFKIQL